MSLIVMLWSALMATGGPQAAEASSFAPAVVALSWLAVYLVASTLAFGSPYLFASAYIVCLFVFHFGLLLQDAFGWLRVIWNRDPDMTQWAVLAGWYSNLALAAIGTGFSGFLLTARPTVSVQPEQARRTASYNLARLRSLSIGLLLATLALLLLSIFTMGNLLDFTRFELFYLSRDTRFVGLFVMVGPTAALAYLISAYTPAQRRWGYVVALIAFLVFLGTGIRSQALFPALVGVILWVKLGRRLNPVLAACMLLGALMVIPIVGYLRNLGTYGEITTAESVSLARGEADIQRAFAEMGRTLGIVAYTLKLIPEEEDYRMGRSYVTYLKNAIPNVGFTMSREAGRQKAGVSAGGSEEWLFQMDPASWATFQIVPLQYASGGGTGFSGVAEPYFNFGFPGVVIFFLLLGAFFGALDRIPLLLHYNWLVFATLAYWHLLPTVRNEFGNFTKPVAFIFIIVGIWVLLRRVLPFGAAPRPATGRPLSRVTSASGGD